MDRWEHVTYGSMFRIRLLRELLEVASRMLHYNLQSPKTVGSTPLPSAQHIAPCGRAYRGEYRCPSRRPTLGRKCLNLNQKKCKFLLCCRCCQGPFPIFSFPHFFS